MPIASSGYLPPNKSLIAGIEFDASQPNAYLAKFAIGLKGGQKIEGGNVTGK